MFISVVNSILVLLVIIIAGFICQKKGIISKEGSAVLSALLINLTLPLLMIVSMQKEFDMELFKNSIVILFIAFLIHMIGLVVGIIICKILKAPVEEKGVWIFTMVFPNTTYMGLPVIESIYGMDAVFYVSMITVVFNILSFSLGIKIITQGEKGKSKLNWKSLAFNMPIIGTVLGFAFFLLSFKLPGVFSKSFSLLGNMTVPLSMLVIGALLARVDVKTIFAGWKIYLVIFTRLIIMPIITFFVIGIFVKDPVILGVFVIIAGMPAATITAILASQYSKNSVEASKIVFLSTLLSIITIPLITLLLN